MDRNRYLLGLVVVGGRGFPIIPEEGAKIVINSPHREVVRAGIVCVSADANGLTVWAKRVSRPRLSHPSGRGKSRIEGGTSSALAKIDLDREEGVSFRGLEDVPVRVYHACSLEGIHRGEPETVRRLRQVLGDTTRG